MPVISNFSGQLCALLFAGGATSSIGLRGGMSMGRVGWSDIRETNDSTLTVVDQHGGGFVLVLAGRGARASVGDGGGMSNGRWQGRI